MRTVLTICATLLLAASFTTHAGDDDAGYRYRWVDSGGQTHFSDGLTGRAMNNGYDIIDDNGRVIEHVHAMRSPEEREKARAQAERRANRKQEQARQARRDRQLLNAFPTETEYRQQQQARLDKLDANIHTTKVNLRSQQQSLSDLLQRAAKHNQKGESVPDDLADRIRKQRQTVATQRDTLNKQRATRSRVTEDVSQKMAHYREVKQKQDQNARASD